MPPATASPQLTREIFGNIPHWGQVLFYVLATLAVAAFVYGIVRRVRLWRQGTPSKTKIDWATALRRLVRDVLLQRRLYGRGLASAAHVLLFSGFFVLLIATILIGIEHWSSDLLGRERTNPLFHKGVYFGVYELVSDTFGVAFLAGCVMFLVRRLRGVGSFARSSADVTILLLLIAIGLTGYVVEGLRIIYAQTPLPGLSPVGCMFASVLSAVGVTVESATTIHRVLWWTHSLLALGFIAAMPYTRLLHSLAGTVNLAVRDHSLGTMSPVSLEEVEATGKIGVGTVADFSRRQLIELDACVSCGRCEDNCPNRCRRGMLCRI
jgi:nitrate reductase gamma subunit